MNGDWGTMLNISGNENYNNVKENAEIFRTGLNLYKNAASKNESSEFVDETNISVDAMQLYQKEQDIKNFAQMALAGMTEEENNLILNDLFTIAAQMRNDELSGFLLNNRDFLDDLLG